MSSQRFQTNDFLIVLEDFNSNLHFRTLTVQSIECKQEKYINKPFFVIVIVIVLFLYFVNRKVKIGWYTEATRILLFEISGEIFVFKVGDVVDVICN